MCGPNLCSIYMGNCSPCSLTFMPNMLTSFQISVVTPGFNLSFLQMALVPVSAHSLVARMAFLWCKHIV